MVSVSDFGPHRDVNDIVKSDHTTGTGHFRGLCQFWVPHPALKHGIEMALSWGPTLPSIHATGALKAVAETVQVEFNGHPGQRLQSLTHYTSLLFSPCGHTVHVRLYSDMDVGLSRKPLDRKSSASSYYQCLAVRDNDENAFFDGLALMSKPLSAIRSIKTLSSSPTHLPATSTSNKPLHSLPRYRFGLS